MGLVKLNSMSDLRHGKKFCRSLLFRNMLFKTHTYLLHGAESFLRSWPVFAASQKIPRIFMEPEGSLPYSQVTATRLYPEPTPSSPHVPLQLPEDPS
jgi:hypothetical protein